MGPHSILQTVEVGTLMLYTYSHNDINNNRTYTYANTKVNLVVSDMIG